MEERERRWERYLPSAWKMLASILIVVLILFAVFGMLMFRAVDVGSAVVLVDPLARTVSGPVVGPAWFIKAPWVSDVYVYYAVDSVSMWTEYVWEAGQWKETARGDFPAIAALSKDGLQIEVDLLVRWSLDPSRLVELYKIYPDLTWKEKAITSIIREVTRNVISQFSAVEVIEKRPDVIAELKKQLISALLEEKSLADAIDPNTLDVDLRDIDPPIDFVKAIEAKLAAQQAKLQAEFEREKIIVLANATAMEQIIKSQGEASARIIVANATKESITLILEAAGAGGNSSDTAQLSQLYLTLEALKEIAKTGQKVVFLVAMGREGGVPLIYVVPINPEE